jgi:hypothetical protein
VIVVWFADATCCCANGIGTLCHYGCSGGEKDQCDFHLDVYGVCVKFNCVVSKYKYRVSGSSRNSGNTKTAYYTRPTCLYCSSPPPRHTRKVPIAKPAQHLGADIEVLKVPRFCSCTHLTGPSSTARSGIAEPGVNSAGKMLVECEDSALGERAVVQDWVCWELEWWRKGNGCGR